MWRKSLLRIEGLRFLTLQKQKEAIIAFPHIRGFAPGMDHMASYFTTVT